VRERRNTRIRILLMQR